MKDLFSVLLIGILFVSCEEATQQPSILHDDFNNQILSGYFVTSIAFDAQGNAWIGTFRQGLIKYNSNETILYNSENSIISDTTVIHDIAVDSKNNVWIGCEGLIKYDGTGFTLFNSENTPIPEDFVSSIAIDSKDNIWLSSSRFRQGGLVKYDNSTWTVYTPENSQLPANLVQSIAIDKDDHIWLALNEIVNDVYLVKIANDNWSVYSSTDLGFSPYYIGNIQIDSQNQLCGAIDYSLSSTAINSGPKVFIFDGTFTIQLQNDSISNIKNIFIDNEDNIWCAASGGYSVFDGKKWTNNTSQFKDESVFAIAQSLDDKIWIGTGDGIYIGD